jgi:putative addiction module component (TIGR02574 family)
MKQIEMIRMDIQSLKVDLIHWLTELQDQAILEQVQAFKHRQEVGLGEAHKALLDERIASYENDPTKVLLWDDVMKELEKDL